MDAARNPEDNSPEQEDEGPDQSPSKVFSAGRGATPSMAMRLVARREHSLLSLMELSHELTVSMDLYGIADFALFNLMGQLGTSKAALWIVPRDDSLLPVLLRAHGIRKQWAIALGSTFGPAISSRASDGDEPTRVADLVTTMDSSASKLAKEAEIALFAPVFARGRLFGFVALGERVARDEYGDADLQVLHASLGMLGVTLENTSLYNHLLEQTRQLKLANENLQQLDRLKSEFLRNVNHELRTPLTIILAYASMLGDQELDRSVHEFVDTIQSEGTRLKGLLEKLLDFSAVSGDGLEITLERGDIRTLVQDLFDERRPGIAESLHEFSCELVASVPDCFCDPQRVRQILDALIDNAIKFTPQGSHIKLSVNEESTESGNWVRVDVTDDGPGIPPERVSGIFDSFRQGDGSTTRTVSGMGMGLALSRKLAEMMGGRLTIRTRTGDGCRFSLYLSQSR